MPGGASRLPFNAGRSLVLLSLRDADALVHNPGVHAETCELLLERVGGPVVLECANLRAVYVVGHQVGTVSTADVRMQAEAFQVAGRPAGLVVAGDPPALRAVRMVLHKERLRDDGRADDRSDRLADTGLESTVTGMTVTGIVAMIVARMVAMVVTGIIAVVMAGINPGIVAVVVTAAIADRDPAATADVDCNATAADTNADASMGSRGVVGQSGGCNSGGDGEGESLHWCFPFWRCGSRRGLPRGCACSAQAKKRAARQKLGAQTTIATIRVAIY